MCLIVDSNSVSQVFLKTKREFEKLNQAVIAGKSRLVYGGELTREYRRINTFWRLLLILDSQGRAMQVDNGRVDRETERLRKMSLCSSDDHHIVALARIGRVRLVCSDDRKLQQDVKDPKLLSAPRGNIYSAPNHDALLRKHCASRPTGN